MNWPSKRSLSSNNNIVIDNNDNNKRIKIINNNVIISPTEDKEQEKIYKQSIGLQNIGLGLKQIDARLNKSPSIDPYASSYTDPTTLSTEWFSTLLDNPYNNAYLLIRQSHNNLHLPLEVTENVGPIVVPRVIPSMGDLGKPKKYEGGLEEEINELLLARRKNKSDNTTAATTTTTTTTTTSAPDRPPPYDTDIPTMVCFDITFTLGGEGASREYFEGRGGRVGFVVVSEEWLSWVEGQSLLLNPPLTRMREEMETCIRSKPGRITGGTFEGLDRKFIKALGGMGAVDGKGALTLTLPCQGNVQRYIQDARRRMVISINASYHKEILAVEAERKFDRWLCWMGVGEGWWGWKEVSGGRGFYHLL